MVEHTTHNRVVGGSNPPTATNLAEALHRSGLLDPRGMLVALSGGPDSTALLIALCEIGIPVVAAHFDHALRPGSNLEAEDVEDVCAGLGVTLVRGRRSEEMPRGSVQAAARTLRYRFLEEARAGAELNSVALGHSADDLVEGVLLHLLRGAGLAGMRGMPARRGPFVRPLLGVWRSSIEAFLEQRSVVPIRDPSNGDRRYARVRVRLDLLPAFERDLPGISGRIHAAALRAAELQAQVESLADGIVSAGGEVSIESLRNAAPHVRAEVFRRLFTSASGRSPSLGARHLEALARLVLRGASGQSVDLPGGITIRRGYQCVQVMTMSRPPEAESALALQPCSGCEKPNSAHFRAGLRLELGTRRPGLRMRPAPGGRSRKLQDVLVDAKVPRHLRDTLPLVFADGELAWVPGIAIDRRFVAWTGSESIHAEVVGAGKPLLESDSPTQGVFP